MCSGMTQPGNRKTFGSGKRGTMRSRASSGCSFLAACTFPRPSGLGGEAAGRARGIQRAKERGHRARLRLETAELRAPPQVADLASQQHRIARLAERNRADADA